MKFKYRCLALSLLLVSALSFAHSGGTDSQGCHVDHKTGVRHCH
ncbi:MULTISPECIES: YHYH domain-containing protein [unclassified Herbaspirillum]|nr:MULTISPECIES: YHYH domain-containing protein [unclassified Herbaspirillum]